METGLDRREGLQVGRVEAVDMVRVKVRAVEVQGVAAKEAVTGAEEAREEAVRVKVARVLAEVAMARGALAVAARAGAAVPEMAVVPEAEGATAAAPQEFLVASLVAGSREVRMETMAVPREVWDWVAEALGAAGPEVAATVALGGTMVLVALVEQTVADLKEEVVAALDRQCQETLEERK